MKANPAVTTRRNRAVQALMLGALLGASLPFAGRAQAAPVAAPRPGAIKNTGGGNVRVRAGANTGYDVKGTLAEGDQVAILEGPVNDGAGHAWYRVSWGSHVGWVDSHYLGGAAAPAASAPKAGTSTSTHKTAVAAPAAAPHLSGYVKVANTGGDAVRLRTTSGTSSRAVALAGPGTVLRVVKGPVVDQTGAWYQVTGANVSGWMVGTYLTSTPAPAAPKPVAQAPPRPAAPRPAATRPKATPKPAAKKPVTLTRAQAAPKPAAKATTPARTGVSRGVAAAPSSLAGMVISTALKYVGYSYRFGGTSPAGFDCSGFVYYVLNRAGIPIGRSMGAEIGAGVHISSSQLQPGDLVYFANTYRGGISHIAIYLGNGKIVHAADYSTGVEISDLWSAYWAAHYAGAVRVIR